MIIPDKKFLSTLLWGLLACLGSTASAVEFEDYDFTRWSQEVTECDVLASHGRDPGHVAAPVTRESMNKAAAIAACNEAVANDPENPRLNYQLGRAYGYSGRGDDAMPYRLKALELRYPQSTFVIGYLYLTGVTIEKNTCRAFQLWQQSAKNRRLAALISLPRHYMRGDFAACEGQLSVADMQAYLMEARRLSSDYYIQMLAEELLLKLEAS